MWTFLFLLKSLPKKIVLGEKCREKVFPVNSWRCLDETRLHLSLLMLDTQLERGKVQVMLKFRFIGKKYKNI